MVRIIIISWITIRMRVIPLTIIVLMCISRIPSTIVASRFIIIKRVCIHNLILLLLPLIWQVLFFSDRELHNLSVSFFSIQSLIVLFKELV